MSNNTLLKFKEAVDEEIIAYEAMEELYKLKQAVLVQCKSDALWGVDAKIVEKMENIKKLSHKRKEAAKYLGDENLTITQVIEKAQNSNDAIAEKLKVQKAKLNVLSNSISLYERTNMDLIKHGLVMVEKTFDIIVNALVPKPNEYNNQGKNIGNGKMQISSMQEEA